MSVRNASVSSGRTVRNVTPQMIKWLPNRAIPVTPVELSPTKCSAADSYAVARSKMKSSAKWRVLLMARELDHGGSERQLAETAMGLDRDRFEVRVAALRGGGSRSRELLAAGIPVITFPVTSFRSPRALKQALRLARYVRKHSIDLVHTFDPPSSAFALAPVRLLTNAIAAGSQRGHMSLAPQPIRSLNTFGERLAHGVVANCKYMTKHVIEDIGVPQNRIHLCYNGLDLSRFHPGTHVRPDSIPADCVVVGTACVLRPEKGLSTLLEGFAEARRANPRSKLLILGSGPLLPDLQEQAKTLGISDDCIFQPSTSDVAPWLRMMDIFVLPSLSEAFSNSLMEAMACGCCTIASRVGGTPELIAHGVRGLLFESRDSAGLADALRKTMADEQLRRSLGAAAHDFIHSNFSRERAAERMGEIYAGLITRR